MGVIPNLNSIYQRGMCQVHYPRGELSSRQPTQQILWVILSLPVGSTNVTNVTTLGVVFYQQQTSQHNNDHQQQMSNNDKCHMVFLTWERQTSKCRQKIEFKQKQVYLHVGRYDFLLFGNTNNEWGHKKAL